MRILTRLSAVQAAYGILGGAYLPFFSASIASRGLSASTIGFLLALATFLRILISPFAGLVADAMNDRRLVMLVFTFAAFIAFVVLVFVQDTDYIFLTAVLGVVLWSSTSPILESATLKAAERSGLSYGAVRVWLSIAFVASNVVCGLLVSQLGSSIVAPWLAVSCGLQFWGIYALPASERGNAAGSFGPHFRATFAEARELLSKPVFLLFLAVCSLIQGSHVVYYTYAGLIWREQGINAAAIGVIWPLGVLAEILLFVFSARVVRRIDPVTLIGFGAAACTLRWTMMAFDPGPFSLLIAQFLHGLTFAVPHLGAMYFILRATPPRLSATAQSLYSMAIGFVSSAALLPAGHLYGEWGARIYLLMSIMAAVAGLLSLSLRTGWTGGRLTEKRIVTGVG